MDAHIKEPKLYSVLFFLKKKKTVLAEVAQQRY